MGNSNSSQINETLSLDSWNLSHLPTLREYLGARTPHIYTSYPKQIPEENVYSNLDLRHFSCPDGELLNSFLETIHTHLKIEFVKENWKENAFPNNLENFKLLDQELTGVTLTKEELDKIREMFNLPLQIEVEKDNEKISGEETEVEESQEESKTEVKNIDITQVYSGYSVYEFPDNSLAMPLNNKRVGLESCFVGSLKNRLVLMAPSEEPTLTPKIRFDWLIVQVGEDRIKLVLENARGVIYELENKKVVEEVDDNHFQNLVSAHQCFEGNNRREMALHGRRYLGWIKKIQEEGEIQAIAGGEIEGEIVSLGEFLEKMKLE